MAPRALVATLVVLGLVALATATFTTSGSGAGGVRMYSTASTPRDWKRTKSNQMDVSTDIEKFPLVMGLKRANIEQMDRVFWDVSTPGHSGYGEHLNHEQMTSLVSPGASAINTVLGWMERHGGIDKSTVTLSRHEDYISVEVTAQQIEQLFNIKFHTYKNQRTGRVLKRALNAVYVPSQVADLIDVISGFRGFPMPNGAKPIIQGTKSSSLGSTETNVSPKLLFDVYNMSVNSIPKTPSGKTNIQSFFQAQGQYVESSDLTSFCKEYLNFTSDFDQAKCKISKYIGPDQNKAPGVESSLDSEYIMATGFGQETWVYSYSGNSFCGDLLSWAKDVFAAADGTFPHVISMSYGSQTLPPYCEQKDVKRLTEDIQKMGTMGISVMIASGDEGSGEQNRETQYSYGLLSNSFPSNIPYATAVGSTTFLKGNSGEEEGASQFGSGGGFCYDQAQPPYQSMQVNDFFKNQIQQPPKFSYNGTTRATPDVSTLGEGFNIISGGFHNQVAGTSCSTPTFSGFITLLNNVRLEKGKFLGFLNPLLYQHPEIFNDITTGNNDVDKDGYGWYASKGWDPVTGLGTPNVGKMIDLVRTLNAKDAKKQ